MMKFSTFWASLVLILCVTLAPNMCHATPGCHGDETNHTSANDEGPLSTTEFLHQETMNQDYQLGWNFNSTHIVFQARVKTNGYIGLGISQNGRMFPSDVVIGWVKDGQNYFYDRHATAYSTIQDDHQDWTLLSASEEGRYTTLVMMRPLETCDDQDMPITPGVNHLIFSYRFRDPDSPDQIYYHGRHRRGSKDVILLVGV